MTEELRLILLAAGILIIAFIAWDATRRKNNESTDPWLNKLSQKITLKKPEKIGLKAFKLNDNETDDVLESESLSIESNDKILEIEDLEEDLVARLEPSFSDDTNNKDDKSCEVTEQDEVIFSTDDSVFASSNVETIQKPKTVITINLMTEENTPFQGSRLLQEALTLGFKYGEMNVFHRYQQSNGQGERWFCLANAFNPGTFEIDKMAEFSTVGLTLFMLLPGPQEPLNAFENMLNAANKLKLALGGRLEDGSHSTLSQQRVELYREEIRYFHRKQKATLNTRND